MRIFNLNKVYNIVCNWQKTNYGFKHIATLHKNGFEIAKTKRCYYNRTWERFEYESVLIDIINANFTDKEKIKFLKVIEGEV
jgi:4-hydroxyphenylpyruvate dioxygenase-like putative hemolysin